ncbi:Beta-barrel assembly machine subunit BamC [Modicisalibacter ilicicola DSM 19980]|uniref:Beta-barrel assembly machine subunit BamC n=1 Tax=Modicisalibacter ilicicola DSM 19980 TaxID=1121942 RepID=A0A1M4UP03_9GAMM|nr:outer membrane protein assembly factor BamC [Halomonas ilicicola]SHE58385.1 Beta-barrel assembly machine subunit BamC [Halomonas ilicicola DSM 19980]
MNPVFKWIPLAVAFALAASGCSRSGYYYDRNEEYREAELAEPLQLPETRRASRYQDAMPVPPASNDFLAEGEFEAPRPQPLAGSRQGEQAFIEEREAGADRWLLVNAAPAAIWPRLQAFVDQRGLATQALDASSGRIVTDQATLSVRQGLRGNTSEVRCENAAGVHYAQCLSALNDYLASFGEQEQSVSLAAQNLSRDDRVRLENAGGEWQLLMALGFDRAWSELFYQLENNFAGEGRRLLDQNRSRGEFLVEYTPRGEEGGFLGLFGDDAETRRYRLEVDEPGQGTTRVRVAAADEAPLSGSDARELLDTLAATLR